jgi:hypothetical protein
MRYDRIYVGACASARSKHLYELLEVGGVMVAPFQSAQRVQQLRRVTRRSETEWFVEVLKLVQFARLQESETPRIFGISEPIWSPESHGFYPRACRSTLEAIGHGRGRLPKEVWMYHIFPWIPKRWFVLVTSTLSTTKSDVKIETYEDGHRVRLGSDEDEDVEQPIARWGHPPVFQPADDDDTDPEVDDDHVDIGVEVNLPPIRIAFVHAQEWRDDDLDEEQEVAEEIAGLMDDLDDLDEEEEDDL